MKFFRHLLFPFALLYGVGVRMRNHAYDSGVRKSLSFDLPVICVGNLVAGGAGKTPMVEYLIRRLKADYSPCMLSRGYGRKTRGFRLADENDTPRTIGDEPYQVYEKFRGEVPVAVGEERALAIPEILFRLPEVDLIILDDAYQHRAVKPSFSILLTEYGRPFYRDHLLPVGMLREHRRGAKRADVVVVTKCPQELKEEEAGIIRENVNKYTHAGAEVFFSCIAYKEPVAMTPVGKWSQVVALTGIANHRPFLAHLKHKYQVVDSLNFPDHHHFSEKDIATILNTAQQHGGEVAVVTTEKDYVRLRQYEEQILRSNISFLYVPIEMKFLFEENKFDKRISRAIIAGERDNL